jgi:CRISPR/Cas system-associated protein Cas10 (large subunit of type III CRISPR-Cas system)
MSSSEQDRVRELAERVARRLEGGTREQDGAQGSGGGELAAVRASLAEIQRRLTHIEAHIAHGEDCGHGAGRPDDARSTPTSSTTSSTPNPSTQARSTWLSGTYVPATTAHPSQEQFEGLGEAVSELVEFFEREKSCTLEPGDKPCDHCGQCSARGF